jgi:hypothetical protein
MVSQTLLRMSTLTLFFPCISISLLLLLPLSPSSLPSPSHSPPRSYPTDTAPIDGQPTRGIIPKTNDFELPGTRFRSFDDARQNRFIARLIGTLQDPQLPIPVRNIVIGYWDNVDNKTLGAALHRAFP